MVPRLARAEVLRAHKAPQRLLTTQIRVIDVQPDPSNCDWGYPTPANGIVRLQTYTLYGFPAQQWTVTCNASWSSWQPLR